MLGRLIRFIVNHPVIVLLTSLSLVVITALGIGRIWVTNDYKVFFEADNPMILQLDKLEATYTKDNNVIFIVGAPNDGDVFDRRVLQLIEALTAAAWKLPYATRVDSLTNYQYSWAEGDDLQVGSLLDNVEHLSTTKIAAAKDLLLEDPMVVGRFVDAQAQAANISITFNVVDAMKQEQEIAAAATALHAQFRAIHPDVPLYITGQVMGNHAFSQAVAKDMATLMPLSYLAMVALLMLLMRSLMATIVSLAVVTLANIVAIGMHGWSGGMINPVVGFAPYMILTVAMADCIHILVVYFGARRRGLDKKGAMLESLTLNLQAVTLTSLTTAVGFLCMLFSDSPPFQVLGVVVAVGVIAALFLSIFTLPALVLLLPGGRGRELPHGSRFVSRISAFVIERRSLVMVMGAIVVGAMMIGLPKNVLDDNFAHYFDRSFDFRVANDFGDQYLPGVNTIHYSLPAPGPDQVTDPDYLKLIDDFARWYRQQQGVGHVFVFSDIMKRLNMNMHGDDSDYYRLPDDSAASAQYLLLYEMSLPFGRDLNTRINMDKSATKMTVYLWSTTSERILALEAAAQKWLAEHAPVYLNAQGVSMDLVFSTVSHNNVGSMLKGSFTALFIISLILIFALRSLKLGLISIIPNILPAVAAFGLWGYLDGRVGLAVSVVVSMALGIVVDDTVHFLSKFNYLRHKLGESTENAIKYAFDTVGVAMIITTIVFVAGFGLLYFSHYLGNSQMGSLTAITIALALIADLLLLPALVLVFYGRKGGDTEIVGDAPVTGPAGEAGTSVIKRRSAG